MSSRDDLLISIIIPTYKGSDKILLPIYSAVQQSYQNIEIIVIDDNGMGSEEQVKTEKILRPLIESKIITYIPHKENRNGSAARNTGFLFSKGEYINFLDDDDYMLPDKLINQKRVLDNTSYNVGAVVCGSFFVHEDGKGYSIIPNCEIEHLQREYLCERVKFNTSAIMFKREAVEKVGGFDESFKRHQDWEFCFRMMNQYRFMNCDKVLLIKYATGRNTAANPEIAVSYYRHFKEKLNPFIIELDKKDQIEIDRYHIRRLYKNWIVSLKLQQAIKYANATGMYFTEQLKAVKELFFHAIKRLVVKNRQRASPIDVYIDEAIKHFNIK